MDTLLKSDHSSLHFNWHKKSNTRRARFPDHLLSNFKLQNILHDTVRESLLINSTHESLTENYYDTIPDDPFILRNKEFVQLINQEKIEKSPEERTRTTMDPFFINKSATISIPSIYNDSSKSLSSRYCFKYAMNCLICFSSICLELPIMSKNGCKSDSNATKKPC